MKANLKNRAFLKAIAAGAAVLFSVPAAAETPFDKFATYDAESARSVNYSSVDEFYAAVTVKDSARRNFRYSVLRDSAGAGPLEAYVDFLAGLSPTTFSKDEQLAYWLNLRNILIIRGIATSGSDRSLKRARGEFENPGEMWTRKRISVEGVPVSIDDIERHIILANFNSPDIVYGLYQGVKGGPAFSPAANFSGAEVHEQLAERGKNFVNARRVLRVRNSEVRAPAVFTWYKDALFNGEDQAVIDNLKGHANGSLGQKLSEVTSLGTSRMNYNLDIEVVRQQRVPAPSSGPVYSGGGGGGGS